MIRAGTQRLHPGTDERPLWSFPVVSLLFCLHLLALALLAAGTQGCATGSSAETRGAGHLRVQANIPDATVHLDGVLLGTVAQWSGERTPPLRAGPHRVEIRHPQHFSHFAEVTIPSRGTAVLQVELRPLLED